VRRLRSFAGLFGLIALAAIALSTSAATADTLGPINFEGPTYSPGDIDGQAGWSKTGPYDSEVASVASFSAATGYGFGAQALRISNDTTSGSFGDQTLSPSLANEAGEPAAIGGGLSGGSRQSHFEASFSIGTTQATAQSGLSLSVSPDRGDGSRMSYVRFDDLSDGVHVYFDDVRDPGPLGTGADFNETSIATLARGQAHTVRYAIDFKPGPANDVVQVFIDGVLRATGTTWEDYYRYDPEQSGDGNVVPTVDQLDFLERGSDTSGNGNAGQGFLIDSVSLASGASPTGTLAQQPSSARCAGRKATIVGTANSDVLKGTHGRDVIVALGGRDRVIGLGGNDVVCGGAGADRISGGSGQDQLNGQGGKDLLAGNGGADRLKGGAGRDTLRGGAGLDLLRGGAGQDSQKQ
jgi:Ca2+-binding RTX toxin-like protein